MSKDAVAVSKVVVSDAVVNKAVESTVPDVSDALGGLDVSGPVVLSDESELAVADNGGTVPVTSGVDVQAAAINNARTITQAVVSDLRLPPRRPTPTI